MFFFSSHSNQLQLVARNVWHLRSVAGQPVVLALPPSPRGQRDATVHREGRPTCPIFRSSFVRHHRHQAARALLRRRDDERHFVAGHLADEPVRLPVAEPNLQPGPEFSDQGSLTIL